MSSTTSAAGHPPGGEMTTIPYDQPRRRHLAGWLPFIRHYIENGARGDAASADVINEFAKLDVAGVWGTGHVAGTDGSQIETWGNNILVESDIRYGGGMPVVRTKDPTDMGLTCG